MSFERSLCVNTQRYSSVDITNTNDDTHSRSKIHIDFNHSPITSMYPTKEHQQKFKKILRECVKNVQKRHYYLCLLGESFQHHYMSLSDIVSRLQELRNIDQPIQRSDEWYRQREETITASIFGKLKSAPTQRTHAFHKATQIRSRKNQQLHLHRSSGPACEWGVMFEEVCKMVYAQKNNGVVVEDFGLLPHSSLSYIGASPDGICNEHSPSEYVGRLVEFKAPFSRKIVHNKIPEEYLIQIQGQLFVTKLKCCDYFECAFKLENREDAIKRQSMVHSTHPSLQGMIVSSGSNPKTYVYGMINDLTEQTVNDLLSKCGKNDDSVQIMYWYLEDSQQVMVHHNFDWFSSEMLPKIEQTYKMFRDFVENDELYQQEYEKRKKKRVKKQQPVYLFRDT